MTGKFPPYDIDHEDGNGLNNIWTNIRSVTCSENNKNRRLPSNNSSGYIGVCWSKQKNKWLAHIRVNGKRLHLGVFTDINNAITERQAANIQHGFHKNHGQVRPL